MILMFSYHYKAISWYDEMMIGEIEILQNIQICSTLFSQPGLARWEGDVVKQVRCETREVRGQRWAQRRNPSPSLQETVAAVSVSPGLTAGPVWLLLPINEHDVQTPLRTGSVLLQTELAAVCPCQYLLLLCWPSLETDWYSVFTRGPGHHPLIFLFYTAHYTTLAPTKTSTLRSCSNINVDHKELCVVVCTCSGVEYKLLMLGHHHGLLWFIQIKYIDIMFYMYERF